MRECENLRNLMRVQQEWTVGAMRRLAADFAEFGKMTLSLAENTTSQMSGAPEATAGYIGRGSKSL
jgi:hypothetical protein